MIWHKLHNNTSINNIYKYNNFLPAFYIILGLAAGYTFYSSYYLLSVLFFLIITYVIITFKNPSYFEYTLQQSFNNIMIAIYARDKNGLIKYYNSSFSELFNGDKDLIDHPYNELITDIFEAHHYVNVISLSKPTFLKYQYYLIIKLPYNIHYIRKNLLDNSPIATATIDSTGKITVFNKAFQEITDNKQVNNYNFFDIIEVINKNDIYNILDKSLQHPQDIPDKPLEVKINLEKGNITALLYITIDPYELSSSRFICYLIDITEHKNLEMHFIHAQKIQLLGQLTGGIAHDFNNLLTAMTGFCDLLLMRHSPNDQSFADIMQIKQNTNRAINLVRQLLLFSRKQASEPEVIDITHILNELSNLLRRLIGNNITLDIQHGTELYKVKIDPVHLEQIIINLAVNARDAMNHNGSLRIKTSNIEVSDKTEIEKKLINPFPDSHIEPGQYVLLEIEDNGCGIPSNLLSKIFEPFFSTKDASEGTGLGLYTVHNILNQSNSYIFINTELNQGTKFSIFLKRYSDLQLATIQNTVDTSPHLSSDFTGSGTVLIVEDEPPIRMLAAHALMNKGYKTLEASNSIEALALLDKYHEEIVLMITDIMMPGLSVSSLIEQINNLYPNISVIFISGYNDSVILENVPQKNKTHFLPKPFSLHQLISVVKEVLNKN